MTGDEIDRTEDPEGRAVVFDERTRRHLEDGRPELLDDVAAIMSTVARPDHRQLDPRPGRERFYRQDLDGGRWLRVVVDFTTETRMDRHSLGTEQSTGGMAARTITVGGVAFDHHRYDDRGDVLYLNVGEPQAAASGLETVEGHGVHYDEEGRIIGLTLLNVRWTLDRDGAVAITWPEQRLPASALADALPAS